MNLRKIPHFYHITHDLQIVWVIWDIYVDTIHVGQVVKNLDYLPYNKGKPPYESIFYGQDFERVREGHPDEKSALATIKQQFVSSATSPVSSSPQPQPHPSHRLAGNLASP